MTKQLVIQDFSGGITDYHLDAATNRYTTADNLLIYKHGRLGKLRTRPGSTITLLASAQPAGYTRIGTFFYMNDVLFFYTTTLGELYYSNGTTWTEIQGPNTTSLYVSGPSKYLSYDYWQDHLFVTSKGSTNGPTKIFKDGSTWTIATAGLPAASGLTTLSISAQPRTASYRYAVVYAFTYTVGTTSYKDLGTPQIETVSALYEPAAAGMTTPAVVSWDAPPTNLHYDSIVTEVYRTTDSGTIFYKVAEVSGGGTSISGGDKVDDATLVTNEQLYTTGGVVANDAPPNAKLFHVAEDRGYWANVADNVSRVYQSHFGDPDSVPATFYTDVESEIVGMSSVQGRVLLLCEDSIYRIDGSFDERGQGFMAAQKISARANCISGSSAVQTLDGLFWAGKEGFYYTDGYKVIRVNKGWDDSYAEIITSAPERIQGAYDVKKNRIWWACHVSDEVSADNNTCFVLDLNFGISEDMPFTKAVDNGNRSFQPTALHFLDGDMYRGDPRGYVFTHSETTLTDPTVDSDVAASTWGVEPILFNYTSAATSFGQIGTRKMVQRTGIVSDSAQESALSLQVTTITDDGRKFGEAKPIKFTGGLIWGDANAIWGEDYRWGLDGISDAWRRVPAKARRCNFSQTKLTNANVAIYKSDTLGTATVDESARTVTLDSGSFPSDVVGYSISLAADSYVAEHVITAVSSGTVTFDNVAEVVDASASGWVIRGVPKDEALKLLSITQHYDVFGKTQESYSSTASATGENA